MEAVIRKALRINTSMGRLLTDSFRVFLVKNPCNQSQVSLEEARHAEGGSVGLEKERLRCGNTMSQ